MLVLVLNAGSSSQKSCLYRLEKSIPDIPLEPLWEAHLDWAGTQRSGTLTVRSNGIKQKSQLPEKAGALNIVLNTLIQGKTKVLENLREIDLVGHRVVHGGGKFNQPVVIDEAVKDAIASFIPLAPNHNPAHLEGIRTITKILPEVPQVAVFDTAFHTTIPKPAKVYPIPYRYFEQGIQRYGFHGISHQYCGKRAAQILQQPLESLKIVTCHLGNGCSLAAIKYGLCIDTTMGFSPLEGLMMGTRSGSIDPEILIYLMQEHSLSSAELHQMLNQESGLLGVSGISADFRVISPAIAEGNTQAQLAFDMYVHCLKSAIGAMVASLNGLDVLVFTAGVGENHNLIREQTCQGLRYLDLQLDLDKNNASPVDENIAQENSLPVLVIHTQEDWAIAVATANLNQQAKS